MNARTNIAKWTLRITLCLTAAIAIAGTGCDETDVLSAAYGTGVGGTAYDGWYNYGFSETDGNGNTRSFSLNSGTSAHDALETYLSDSVVYP